MPLSGATLRKKSLIAVMPPAEAPTPTSRKPLGLSSSSCGRTLSAVSLMRSRILRLSAYKGLLAVLPAPEGPGIFEGIEEREIHVDARVIEPRRTRRLPRLAHD